MRRKKLKVGDAVMLRVDRDGWRRAGPGLVEAIYPDGITVRWTFVESAALYRYAPTSLVAVAR